ncbi:MAG TPA: DUF302 domain-containing protein [Candidatus Nanopelagicaceae bacterium]
MTYAMSLTLDRPFDDVVKDVREALAQEGFGVVSEIDMQATLRTKIGVEIEKQLILGACSPTFANRALKAEPSIGLLLPCNVVIRVTDEGTLVEMINPQFMAEITGSPEMHQIADEVTEKLNAAMDHLKQA